MATYHTAIQNKPTGQPLNTNLLISPAATAAAVLTSPPLRWRPSLEELRRFGGSSGGGLSGEEFDAGVSVMAEEEKEEVESKG